MKISTSVLAVLCALVLCASGLDAKLAQEFRARQEILSFQEYFYILTPEEPAEPSTDGTIGLEDDERPAVDSVAVDTVTMTSFVVHYQIVLVEGEVLKGAEILVTSGKKGKQTTEVFPRSSVKDDVLIPNLEGGVKYTVTVNATIKGADEKYFARIIGEDSVSTLEQEKCESYTCENGACTDKDGVARCICDDGWFGAHCDEEKEKHGIAPTSSAFLITTALAIVGGAIAVFVWWKRRQTNDYSRVVLDDIIDIEDIDL